MNAILIQNVVIFGPDGRFNGNCLIEDGQIRALSAEVPVRPGGSEDLQIIDGQGHWLWPGVIDGHVHFREPGATYKEDWLTGSQAAVAGGVTSVLDMPNTQPPTTTIERLEQKRALAARKSLCNFGLFFGAGIQNHREIHMASNVAGLKVFMGCSTGDLLVHREEDLDAVFAAWQAAPGDQPICVHAESEERLRERAEYFKERDDPAVHSEIRDPVAAAEAVQLACRLALDHGCHLHILHLSTARELAIVAEARQQARRHGLKTRITCEVCPHHLFLSTDAYATLGTRARVNPPLREESERQAMWRALNAGEIDMIATDHAPHSLKEKDRPYRDAPSGLPGVETLLPLLLDAAHRGLCTYEQVVDWLCHNPARIYGIAARGQLRAGFQADLTLIDPTLTREVRDHDQFTRSAWSPWSGRSLTGWPVMTWVNGALVFRRDADGPGEIVGARGLGQELEFSS